MNPEDFIAESAAEALLQDVCKTLRADVAALRKDAERYRWLRDKGSNTWVPFTGQWKMDAEHCNAAIDNEMATQRLLGDA